MNHNLLIHLATPMTEREIQEKINYYEIGADRWKSTVFCFTLGFKVTGESWHYWAAPAEGKCYLRWSVDREQLVEQTETHSENNSVKGLVYPVTFERVASIVGTLIYDRPDEIVWKMVSAGYEYLKTTDVAYPVAEYPVMHLDERITAQRPSVGTSSDQVIVTPIQPALTEPFHAKLEQVKGVARRVYKYDFPICEDFELHLPYGWTIVHVCYQDPTTSLAQAQMWVEVDPNAQALIERFALRGTGHELPKNGHHVATFMSPLGNLVRHLYHLS